MAAIKIDESKLFDGIFSTKDLAELFDISTSTFYRNKEKIFEVLGRYCEVEEFDRGRWFLKRK